MGNAWLLFNHESNRIHRRNNTMSQYRFKRLVAEAWIKQNRDGTQRRRRSRSNTPVPPRGRTNSSLVIQVPPSVRYDEKNHHPASTCGKKNRIRCSVCNAQTTIYCTKCGVHLCVMARRNCFIPFHDKDDDLASPEPSVVEPASPQQPSDDNPDSPPALNVEDLLRDESNEELLSALNVEALLCDESNEELLRYESNE